MVQGDGFEPSKLARQIYSLIPLATREPLPKNRRHFPTHTTDCQLIFLTNSQSYNTQQSKLELARGIEPPTG